MAQVTVNEEYMRALHLGQKEKKKLEAAGKDPCPVVLSERYPETAHCAVVELPVQDIPADRIVGTKTKTRAHLFSASFLPLASPDSEFAGKWTALCEAHLSDVGIRDPIECCEYLGNFYVQEGHKRVSVLRYFDALRIPARILRILPADRDDPRVIAYYEFVDFHRATGIYDLQFRKPGDYARLYAAIGKAPDQGWSEEEIRSLSGAFHRFKQAFLALGGRERDLQPEDALLLFLKVYPYEKLVKMSQEELKKALEPLWGDVQASSEPDAITLRTQPKTDEKLGVIGKLITAVRHLNVAFIYQQDGEISPWTAGHVKGAHDLEEALGDAVRVKNYFHADSPEEAEKLLDEAALNGADLVFTTTPPLLASTLRAAVKYPKITYFNCSAGQPLSSVRSYYCRTYEGKFITGMIAGALAENGLVGYVGSYPILGVPASINAFSLGARMTNPRAKVLLEWSCLEGDCVEKLIARGASVISNRDIPLPDPGLMQKGRYGTFRIGENGVPHPVASPCWVWGKLYEKIVRAALSANLEKKEQSEAVNYWWGMDSGVIDVTLSDDLPEGLLHLAQTMIALLKKGELDPFAQKLTTQDGSVICDGENPLSSLEILQMKCLSDAVEGSIPTYGELLPMSRTLVRELGGHIVEIPPESEGSL